MGIIYRIMGFLTGWTKQTRWYYENRLKPEMDRGVELGIPAEFVVLFATRAIEQNDTTPHEYMRVMVDNWVRDTSW